MSFLSSTTWGDSPASSSVSVALWPGYAALAAALASSVVLLLGSHQGIALPATGYTLGAVVTPVFAIVHRVLFESRRKSPWFVPSPTQKRLLAVALALGLLAGLANAWFLATELAKR